MSYRFSPEDRKDIQDWKQALLKRMKSKGIKLEPAAEELIAEKDNAMFIEAAKLELETEGFE